MGVVADLPPALDVAQADVSVRASDPARAGGATEDACHAACLFNAASTASRTGVRGQPSSSCTPRSVEPGAGGHTPPAYSLRNSTSSSRLTLMLAGSGPASGCGPSVSSRPSTTRAVYLPSMKLRSICMVVCGLGEPFTTTP